MDRDEFFAQLDKLAPKEIDARLSSWDKERLVLVREYLAKQGKAPQIVHPPRRKRLAIADIRQKPPGRPRGFLFVISNWHGRR
jgi:hypothetical protein